QARPGRPDEALRLGAEVPAAGPLAGPQGTDLGQRRAAGDGLSLLEPGPAGGAVLADGPGGAGRPEAVGQADRPFLPPAPPRHAGLPAGARPEALRRVRQ